MTCPNCFTGTKAPGTPTGTTHPTHGYPTYTATPPNPTSTLILFTDAFAHHLPNSLLLADSLAQKTNATVLVPDLIPGGGMNPAILPLMDRFSAADTSGLRKLWALVRAMVFVVPFLLRARPQRGRCVRACVAYARAVRGEMEGSGQKGKLGVVGYCCGGYQALRVAGVLGEGVGAVFVAHPARFEGRAVVELVRRGVKVGVAHAGEDMSLPLARVEEVKGVLEGEEGFEVVVYEGCVHGFAVRATPGKEREVEAAGEALEQAVRWFGKWL
ncbi:hypothetical protein EKO04_003844 [Ascochyta lentis]|uniref:Dienelactone hydrolase domain-containing protein n=1 Tax=Ascochyta lentis TaxID=205686 RepID=A0A8H7J8W3_9PLEO|nr:hypothetical protein EKO04_003844 [Ascochyta lentis]